MDNKFSKTLRKAVIAAGMAGTLTLAACDASQTTAALSSALGSSSSGSSTSNGNSSSNGTNGSDSSTGSNDSGNTGTSSGNASTSSGSTGSNTGSTGGNTGGSAGTGAGGNSNAVAQVKAAGELVDIQAQIDNVSHVGDDEWDASTAKDVTAQDGAITITEAGVYRITGDVPNGVTVNAPKDAVVVLILDNANISNAAGAAINVVKADDVVISLEGNNTVTSTGFDANADANAAIYAAPDLTITGDGTLNVNSENDGVTTKDDLYVLSGKLNVIAADDGLRGKDSLTIAGGTITVDAKEGHALKSDQDNSVVKGLVHITGGTLDLKAGKDGINAFNTAQIDGGTITMAVGDDAVHAEVATVVNAGTLRVTESVEGLEGGLVTVAGGDIDITSSDDAINASGSLTFEDAIADAAAEATSETAEDTTETATDAGQGTNPANGQAAGQQPPAGAPQGGQMSGGMGSMGGGMPGGGMGSMGGGMPGGGMGGMGGGMPGGGMEESTGEQLLISGGNIVLNAEGDGIDSNGDLLITGGNITVYGPTGNGDGAMDVAGTFSITGGTLAAIGSPGMAQGPNSTSGQGYVMTNVSISAGQTVSIKDASGNVVASYVAKKTAGNVLFSSPAITSGQSYTIDVNGATTRVTAR